MFCPFSILLALSLILYLLLQKWRPNKSSKSPPVAGGSIPLLGHLLWLRKDPHKVLARWSHKLGPIFTVYFGSFQTVVINDGELIKKAFKLTATSGRPYIKLCDEVTLGRQGIVLADDAATAELRNFYMKHLNNFNKEVEWRAVLEVQSFLRKLETLKDRPIQVHGLFKRNVVNTLLSILVGTRFAEDDPRPAELAELMTELAHIPKCMEFFGMYLPTLATWFPGLFGYKKRLMVARALMDFFRPIVEEHERTRVKGQARDILDLHLERIEDATDESSVFYNKPDRLYVSLMEFLFAGMESTSNQLEWIIYHLAKSPEVQRKAQAEIDRILGTRREPSVNDRGDLPYIEAVILEALRTPTVGPIAIGHRALEDFELEGYLIRKDTTVLGNLYGAHHDPNAWDGDPNVFRPERFLDCSGMKGREERRLKHRDSFVPFSTGKRICSGEKIVRNQLFLYTAGILQKYSITAASDFKGEADFALAIAPAPFKVVFTAR